MKSIFTYAVTITAFSLCTATIVGCDNSGIATEKSNIKIIFTDIASVIDNESGKLSDDARLLLSGLEGTKDKCKHAFILEPVLVRPDLRIDTSISTKIEKSPIAAATSVRDFKLVQQNLDNLTISSRFLQKPASKPEADSLFRQYVLAETVQDSLLLLMEKNAPDSLTVNGKRYKVLTNSNDVRIRILSILCQNPKASFALLINPPLAKKPDSPIKKSDGPVIADEGQKKPTELNNLSKKRVSVSHHVVKENKFSHPIGDLTIIKGSEGCDICTHYYSATDNVGRRHEVKEKNSTFCCPCDKTVEIKGRTYRMECNGSSNRLALME